MIRYQKHVLDSLKSHGYSSYRIRQDKLMSQKQLQDIRDRKVTLSTLDILCTLLQCQPGDILEYIPEQSTDNETPN